MVEVMLAVLCEGTESRDFTRACNTLGDRLLHSESLGPRLRARVWFAPDGALMAAHRLPRHSALEPTITAHLLRLIAQSSQVGWGRTTPAILTRHVPAGGR
jgi:hypothetical protein